MGEEATGEGATGTAAIMEAAMGVVMVPDLAGALVVTGAGIRVPGAGDDGSGGRIASH